MYLPSAADGENPTVGGGQSVSDPIDAGQLYVVSTPIGNLGDFSARAIETLQRATVIVAEDTRHSRTLLDHYGIATSALAYHEHNEARETPKLIARLQRGEQIALISDAGTPLLSDPGARLVDACIEAGIDVVPVPGASALLASLVASGLAADRFSFYGFLDRKGSSRAQAIREIVQSPITTIIYESPNRVGRTLRDLTEAGADSRRAVIARELTKRFEEFQRGTVAQLARAIGDTALRGEVVILVDGCPAPAAVSEDDLRRHAAAWRDEGATTRDITDRLIAEYGAARNFAYRLAQETA